MPTRRCGVFPGTPLRQRLMAIGYLANQCRYLLIFSFDSSIPELRGELKENSQ